MKLLTVQAGSQRMGTGNLLKIVSVLYNKTKGQVGFFNEAFGLNSMVWFVQQRIKVKN